MRKYTLNEDFFQDIDSEEKAYWLGFITADGCIANGHGQQLVIALQITDKDHLEKFLSALETDRPVSQYPDYKRPNARIAIGCTKLLADLARHGVHPRKAHTIEPPTFTDDDLARHYWRGVFDGDGSIGKVRARGQEWWMVNLTGNMSIVQAFADFAGRVCRTKAGIWPNKSSWQWTCQGVRFPRLIAERLYHDCRVALDRKLSLAEALMATPSIRAERTYSAQGGVA